MLISEIIIFVLAVFMILGAIDKCLKNRFGLGEKFDEGFMALGPLAIAMIGIVSFAPVLAKLLKPVLVPIYSFLGADPAMFATSILANDMGGYPLAIQLAQTTQAGLFAGLILGSMLGATIVFSIPVALGIIRKEDHKFLAKGVMIGLITIPLGCIAGGLFAGFGLKMILLNLVPVIIFSSLIALGLLLIPEKMVKGFHYFSQGVLIIITISTAAIVFETLTSIVIIPGMAPLLDGLKIVGAIAIVLLGAFPFIYVLTKLLKKPLAKLGSLLKINEISVAGMLASLANNIPMFKLMKGMDDRGKVINVAFCVSAAFVFGDHLGFTAGVNKEMILPVLIGKLIGGITAVSLAIVILQSKRQNNKRMVVKI